MFHKIFKIIFFITLLIGIGLLIKPICFYSKGVIVQFLLTDSWNDYKSKRIKIDRDLKYLKIKIIPTMNTK